MKTASSLVPKLASLLLPAALLPAAVSAQSDDGLTDEDLLLGGNPIVIKTRVKLANEFTNGENGAHSDKVILSGIYGFGFNDRDRPFGIGFELPFLYNDPDGSGSDAGVGDLKLRFGHVLIDDPKSWRAGWFFDTELDTAADDVQAIANQRTQMASAAGEAMRSWTISSSPRPCNTAGRWKMEKPTAKRANGKRISSPP